MTTLPAYGEIVAPRPEVLEPALLLDVVDLSPVSGTRKRRGPTVFVPGREALTDPERFFDLTYPTAEIKQTLEALSARHRRPTEVPGTVLLAGRYGLGKSHVLLAAHHALTHPRAAAAWAARWGLGDLPLPEQSVVLTRSFIQHGEEPLWTPLLDGRPLPAGKDFLDGTGIEELLGERPVFLILDELERWYGTQDELAKQRSLGFLQAATEVSMRTGKLTVLTSVFSNTGEPGETVRRVRPLELKFQSARDRENVLLYRLFGERLDSANAAANAATQAYAATYAAAGLPHVDAYCERLRKTWPFSPEFMDILVEKVPDGGGFQATRGSLRFLAHVVRHTFESRPLITSQDLPLRDDTVAKALANLDKSGGDVVRRALGDNYEAVPEDLPHKDELFSALLFYSIADPTNPGATRDDVLLATLDPGENPNVIRDSLERLRGLAFNLHERDDRFVFLTEENPHARINALASSQRIGREAVRTHILDALTKRWGDSKRTAVYADRDKAQLADRLSGLSGQRPRLLLSTVTLDPATRLELQNLSPDRNLVLLVEPLVHTGGGGSYSLLADEALAHPARRIEACALLLESRPSEEARAVYADVHRAERSRLSDAIAERYGRYIAWHRAGASGSEVDESWYDAHPLDHFGADTFLADLRRDYTSQAEVGEKVAELWRSRLHSPVGDLVTHFDRTPGLPVPCDKGMVEAAVVRHVRAGLFSLIAPDGTPITKGNIDAHRDALRPATIAEPRRGPEPTPPKVELLTHTLVSAQYDAQRGGVCLTWSYPPAPGERAPLRTLVQRYATARQWELGREYPLDTDASHDANRYHGDEASCVDAEQLEAGKWYLYYVFLEQQAAGDSRTYVLSQRCDVAIPEQEVRHRRDVLDTGSQKSHGALQIELEKQLLSGRFMTGDSKARKLELRMTAVAHPALSEQVAPTLAAETGGDLTASGDLTYVVRGSYTRQDVLRLARSLPRIANARYAALVELASGATEDGS